MAAIAALAFCTKPCVSAEPTMLDPELAVQAYFAGVEAPTAMAFLGPGELLVLEKNSGRVIHLLNNGISNVPLDLAVNNASERGLLGIALDPSFEENGYVYLYWTCRSLPPSDPFHPAENECPDEPELGGDSSEVLEVPLLGNRVDRFVWDGANLRFDLNLIKLRAFQNDAAPEPPGQGDRDQRAAGNHDGGVIRFGPDGMLYVITGDLGRRGALQNLPSGPTPTGRGTEVPDDQFGGPAPDDVHFSGVILRLNTDGSAPTDNPFYDLGDAFGDEIGENLQRLFVYGIRNSFGMAFDPLSGHLWWSDNGEDAFDELNRADPGQNGGWIQVMGPIRRVTEYKAIEITSLHGQEAFPNLQQLRWAPENIAESIGEAVGRIFLVPGAHYSDPEFSWKNVIAPAAIGFMNGQALGPQFDGSLFVGLSVPEPDGGVLLRFELTDDRRRIAVDEPALQDRVDDNSDANTITESTAMIIGRDFGIVTDIQTGPNGNLFVVSLSNGTIYEVFRR
jgi:glucose/arabinose dehydrogenase